MRVVTAHYVLTGATGFLGSEILAELLRSGAAVTCLVRTRRRDPLARLRQALTLAGVDPEDRLRIVTGDLSQAHGGLAEADVAALRGRVDEVVHAAALIGFLIPPEQLRRVNVGGTHNALALARSLGAGVGFTHVSTAYAAGRVRGEVGEADAPPARGTRIFRNPYEQSKCEAEAVVRGARDVPWTILRPSIIIGSSAAPRPVAGHSLSPLLKALATSRSGLIPARRAAPIDFVAVDYVARAAAHIVAARRHRARTFHLVSGASFPMTLGAYVDAINEDLRRDLPPLRCLPPAVYSALARPVLCRLSSPTAQRVVRIGDAFLPYFASALYFDDSGAREALAGTGIAPPEPAALFRRILRGYGRAQGRPTPARTSASPPLEVAR
jgi:thioester reductase-like protein